MSNLVQYNQGVSYQELTSNNNKFQSNKIDLDSSYTLPNFSSKFVDISPEVQQIFLEDLEKKDGSDKLINATIIQKNIKTHSSHPSIKPKHKKSGSQKIETPPKKKDLKLKKIKSAQEQRKNSVQLLVHDKFEGELQNFVFKHFKKIFDHHEKQFLKNEINNPEMEIKPSENKKKQEKNQILYKNLQINNPSKKNLSGDQKNQLDTQRKQAQEQEKIQLIDQNEYIQFIKPVQGQEQQKDGFQFYNRNSSVNFLFFGQAYAHDNSGLFNLQSDYN